MTHVHVFLATFLVCCGYALVRGGAPERIAAGIFILAVALTSAAASGRATRFYDFELGIFLVDLGLFLALFVLAQRANRFWPLWMSSIQALAVAFHPAMLLQPDALQWVYAFVHGKWSYLLLLILAAGTWRHRARLERFGADPSWRSSSSRSTKSVPAAGPTSS